MVVVVAQQKGGVGKTTTAANVGVLLARLPGTRPSPLLAYPRRAW